MNETSMRIYIGRNVLVVTEKDFFYNGIVKDITPTHLLLLDRKTNEIISFSYDNIKSIEPKGELQ